MKRFGFFVLLLLTGSLLHPSPVLAQAIDPQYIFVRKAPDICNPTDCSLLWSMADPNRDFGRGIDDIVTKVGTTGTNQRKLGVGVAVYYNRVTYDFVAMQQALRRLLETATAKNIPLFIALDGYQWWDGRPDLWNFWDQSKPGYNPANRNNVERINSSDPVYAVTKAWRNWGSEFELSPPPNLASRTFIDDSKSRLSVLLPIIVNWYKALPADKKWLLGGISLGVETDIGGNFYFYKNGVATGKGLADTTQLGYAAISTLGLTGGVTQANLNTVIQRYQNELDKLAYDLGIPRNKIFNHVGGFDLSPNPIPAGLAFPSTDAGVTAYGAPGWSFYGSVTDNPGNFSGIQAALNKVGNTQWASPEFRSFGGNYTQWLTALRGSLNYRNNRFINLSNWDDLKDQQYVVDAVKTVVNESPACWVTTPTVDVTINGDSATITWQKGTHNDAIYLQVSTAEEFNLDGTLKTPYVANEGPLTINTKTINMTNEKYYWVLAADGCGGTQRKIADGSFQKTSPTPTPTFLPGDLDHNGKVDIFDYSQLVSHFGQISASAGWMPAADINKSGKVDIFDYTILLGNFGK